MVSIGSNTQRAIEDIMLTRYACYLIAQNGDMALFGGNTTQNNRKKFYPNF